MFIYATDSVHNVCLQPTVLYGRVQHKSYSNIEMACRGNCVLFDNDCKLLSYRLKQLCFLPKINALTYSNAFQLVFFFG